MELGTPPAFLPPSLLLLLLHAIIQTPPALLRAQIPAPTSRVRSRTSPAREKTGTDFGSKALVLLVCKAIRKSTSNNNKSNTESLSLSAFCIFVLLFAVFSPQNKPPCFSLHTPKTHSPYPQNPRSRLKILKWTLADLRARSATQRFDKWGSSPRPSQSPPPLLRSLTSPPPVTPSLRL